MTASVVNYLYFTVIGDRHVGIYASPDNWRTCLFLRRILVTDISGVGCRRAMNFCVLVDLEVERVISPFDERSTVVSPVRQTCPTVADRVTNRLPLAR